MIKKIALSALFVSCSAFAHSLDSMAQAPWTALLADSTLKVQAPSVTLGYEGGSIQVSVFQVCKSGAQLELIAGSTQVCAKPFYTRGGVSCAEHATVKPVGAVLAKEEVCKFAPATRGNTDCSSYLVDYSKEMSIPVYSAPSRAGQVLKFTKTYSIPACSDAQQN